MKKNEQGIPIVNRKELQLIKDRMDQKGSTKGLVIMGKPGTGKTTIVRQWLKPVELIKGHSETDYRFNLRQQAQHKEELISSNSIVSAYMTDGTIKTNAAKHIDDLGTEPIANHFGTTLDVIPFIIQSRYEWQQKINDKGFNDPQFGYYTTNLNYDELNERYGERVMDRLREMCYFLILEDTSFRKLSTAEQINEDLQ